MLLIGSLTKREAMVKQTEKHVCAICGKEFVGWGNNALPVADGLCCDECNYEKVIPARLKALTDHKSL